jgi:DNA replication and repair protein RecF
VRIQQIILHNFRAHENHTVEFSPGINIIHGPNGIGKTNILEAIHYLCLTKSFLTSTDQYALRQGTPFFQLDGHFSGIRRKDLSIRLVYAGREGKRALINGSRVEKLSTLVGQLPVVVFSPEDQTLTSGGPEERRRFLNNSISQASVIYLEEVMRYRRTLRQRNEILLRARKTREEISESLLSVYTESLVQAGSSVILARLNFIERFKGLLRDAYLQLRGIIEEPRLSYQPFRRSSERTDPTDIETLFREALGKTAVRERERGITLVGPHRDEVTFYLDGREVRQYASQGQHRTFGLALKLAQYEYLYQTTEEPPVMLLDDIFDNLDRDRISIFLNILREEGNGQCIISAARKEIFDGLFDFSDNRHRMIEMIRRPDSTKEETRPIEYS